MRSLPRRRRAGRRRAVVVGAGHHGLVAAIRLAEEGVETVVVEQAGAPGGALSSAELTLPGFVHDVHAGFMPQAVVSPAMRRLPLERHGVEWVNPAVPMVHPFEDGSAIALHRDIEETAAGLERAAPGAGDAWAALLGRLWPHRGAAVQMAMSPPPPVRPALRLAIALRRDGIELGRGMAGSAASLGLDLLGDRRAAAWLCGSVGHSDLTPGSAGSGGLAFGLAFLGHVAGWPFPRGGAGRLTDALVSHLQELGGEVRCGVGAESIVLDRGRPVAVRLAGGERLPAEAVVATAGAGPLLRLLPPGALGGRVERRLARWRPGLGTFKLDLALSGPVPWRNEAAREAAVVHVGGELEDLFRSPQEAGRGLVPEQPLLVVGQHTVHDASRAPRGRHTLYIYARVPSEPDVSDEEIAARMERRIECFAPGFRELIHARSMRGPRRIEDDDPALVGGDLAAGSVEVDQLLIFRPAPELWRGRTPVPGLYVAGGWVHPGPGIHGVSGDAAGKAATEHLR
jgi:phytoene dehydrogenase-like protein